MLLQLRVQNWSIVTGIVDTGPRHLRGFGNYLRAGIFADGFVDLFSPDVNTAGHTDCI